MTLFDDPKFGRLKWLFLTGGLLCLVIAFSLTIRFGGKFAPDQTNERGSTEFVTQTESEAAEDYSREDRWVVYVTGAVMRPGVYEVPAGARVNDALQRAGGFSVRAEPEAINLAAKIEDGEHIKIPEKSGANNEGKNTLEPPPAQNPTPHNAPGASPVKKQQVADTGRIDINRASAGELQNLPGIGPKLSLAIVEYREANGPFRSAEALGNVRGIGAKRFEAVRDLITVAQQ